MEKKRWLIVVGDVAQTLNNHWTNMNLDKAESFSF